MLQDHFTGTEIASRFRQSFVAKQYSPIASRKQLNHVAHIEKRRLRISCFADPRKTAKGRIWVNISGNRYQLTPKRLSKYPNSLLSDKTARAAYYDFENDEYFFDRNRTAFDSIYHFYQTNGVLIWPENFPVKVLIDELKFYGLYECVDKEMKKSLELPAKPEAIKTIDPNGATFKLQKRLWQVFEEPNSSLGARIWGFVSSFATVVSIILTCIHPFPTYIGFYHTESSFLLNTSTVNSSIKKTITQATSRKTNMKHSLQPASPEIFFVELVCFGFFTLEYLLRFLTSPRKRQFTLDFLNLLDLVAIIPFYVGLAFSASSVPVPSFACLRVVHLTKLFLVFNQRQCYHGARVMGLTIKTSLNDFATLIFLVMVATVLFSSFLYYFENWESEKNTENRDFESIPASFWWAVITLTTVGYGDMVPKTLGKCKIIFVTRQ